MMFIRAITLLLLSACYFGNDRQLSVKSLIATQRTVLAQVRSGEITFESAFRHFIVKQDYSGLHNLLQHENIDSESENIYRLLLSASTVVDDDDFAHKAYSLLHRVLDNGRMNAFFPVYTIISKNLSQSLKTVADDVVALYEKTVSSWPGKNLSSLVEETAPAKKVADSLLALSDAYEEFEYLYLNISQGDRAIGSFFRVFVDKETRQISRDIARSTLLGAFASPRQDFVGIVDQLAEILLWVNSEQLDTIGIEKKKDLSGVISEARLTEAYRVKKTIDDFSYQLSRSHLWSPSYSLPVKHRLPYDFRMGLLEKEIVKHQLENSSLEGEQFLENTIDEAISLVKKYLDGNRDQLLAKAVKVIESAAPKGNGIEMTQEVIGIVAEEAGISVAKIMQDKHEEEKEKLAELATQQQNGYDEQLRTVTETLITTVEKPVTDRVTRASFLFTGSDQAAKVDLAKMIANFSLNPINKVIKIKMNESVYSIVGRPSDHKYVSENYYGGTLVDKIRANPRSVVLFELEDKVEGESDDDRSVLDILKKILNEGRLTDSFGNIVSFHEAIVIVTSNTAVGETFAKDFDAEIAF